MINVRIILLSTIHFDLFCEEYLLIVYERVEFVETDKPVPIPTTITNMD